MKQPDSLKLPTRRAVLRSGIGAGALFVNSLAALAAAPLGSTSGATVFAPVRWQKAFRMRPGPA